jgi:hypothetical protein
MTLYAPSGAMMEASGETLLLTLREKQARFAYMVSQLILFAYFNGLELTLGGAYATTGHSNNSLHYERLAIDLNLFKNGGLIS